MLEASLVALVETLVEGIEHTLRGPSIDEMPTVDEVPRDILVIEEVLEET